MTEEPLNESKQKSRERFYPFLHAVEAPDRTEAERLLAADPTLLEVCEGTGETALHFLAIENDLESVRWLMDRGADVSTKDDFDSTPLMVAAQLGHEAMCHLLLDNGADTRAHNTLEDTALSYATEKYQQSPEEAYQQAIFTLLLSRVEPTENINDYFESLTASRVLGDGGPVANLLAARGLVDPYAD